MTAAALNVLIVEDEPHDAELMEHALRESGFVIDARRVETRAAFERALAHAAPDVVLTDLSLPHFDGRTAIRLARERYPGVPVVVVTGTEPDEAAAKFLQGGATDYILKDRLARLGPAVRAAIAARRAELAAERAEGSSRRFQEALHRSEVRYRRLFQTAQDGVLILDARTGVIEEVNPFLHVLLGYTRQEIVGKTMWDGQMFGDVDRARRMFADLQRDRRIRFEDMPLRAKDGTFIDVEFVCNIYDEGGREVAQCNIRDIRARKAQERRLLEQLDELRRFEKMSVDRELRIEELKAELRKLREQGSWPPGAPR